MCVKYGPGKSDYRKAFEIYQYTCIYIYTRAGFVLLFTYLLWQVAFY